MKTLIVTAHPSSKGFTHRIAEAYKKTKDQAGHEAEIMNLYDAQWQQEFLRFEDPKKDIATDEVKQAIQEKITQAQELVFVAPMWWFGVPAIMKNFFDQNMSAGFAFTYEGGKKKGLLNGKTARIMITADGPQVFYSVIKFAILLSVKHTCSFCGIKVTSAQIFGDMHKKSEQDREELLTKVQGLAQ